MPYIQVVHKKEEKNLLFHYSQAFKYTFVEFISSRELGFWILDYQPTKCVRIFSY